MSDKHPSSTKVRYEPLGRALLTFPPAGDHLPLPYRVDRRPNPEFSYEGAKNKLANLQSILRGEEGVGFLIPGDSLTCDDGRGHDEFGSTSRQGRLIRISGWINLDNRVSLGCVGAVLTSLQRKRSAEFLQDDPDSQHAYHITSMEMFSMQGKMYVSVNTMLLLLTLSQVYQCRHIALPPDHPARVSSQRFQPRPRLHGVQGVTFYIWAFSPPCAYSAGASSTTSALPAAQYRP